ncbi:hypothetical protein HDU96_001738 [Phlyctochytrium bullatum]|nr:hypothetical protein HDU96_001738 [Phlyctochytrium bullatum]
MSLPREILTPILILANDLAVAIKLEALYLNLHLRYGSETSSSPAESTGFCAPSEAFIGVDLASIPASAAVSKRCKTVKYLYHLTETEANNFLTRLVTSWLCTYPSHLRGYWGRLMLALVRHNRLPVLRICHTKHWGWFIPELLDEAAAEGHLPVIEFLHTHREESFSQRAMDAAAKNGHLAAVEFLHANRIEGCTAAAMDGAAANGHLAIVQFLHSHRIEGCTTAAMNDAAAAGHLDVVEFLHANGTEGCTTAALDRVGSLEVAKFLVENRREGCTVKAIVNAAERVDLDLLRFLCEAVPRVDTEASVPAGWMCEPPPKIPPQALDAAAAAGSLEAVKYLHAMNPESGGCTVKAMDEAASQGLINIVKFLHENRTEGCTQKAMDLAAKNGHLEVVEFLHNYRTEGCTTAALDGAASSGHFEVVRFLTTHRSEFCSKYAIEDAAIAGHLDIVQFLWHHGAPVSKGIVSHAEVYGQKKVCAWLLDQVGKTRKTADGEITQAPFEPFNWGLLHIAKRNDMGMIELVLQNPHTKNLEDWQGVISCAAWKGDLWLIDRLHRHAVEKGYFAAEKEYFRRTKTGASGDPQPPPYFDKTSVRLSSAEYAAAFGHVNIMAYLHEQGVKFKSNDASAAAVNGHLDVLHYLRSLDPTIPFTRRFRDHYPTYSLEDTVLPDVVAKGHLDVVKYLLEGNDDGGPMPGVTLTMPSFRVAIQYAHVGMLEYLIEYALKPEFPFPPFLPTYRETMLLWAIGLGFAEIVRVLLAKVPEPTYRRTQLQESEAKGLPNANGRNNSYPATSTIPSHRKARASPAPPNRVPYPTSYERALEITAHRGHLSTLRILLEAVVSRPPCTFAAIDAAVEQGHSHVVKYLLDNEVAPEPGRPAPERITGEKAAEIRVEVVVEVESGSRWGCSEAALKKAKEARHWEVVRVLEEWRKAREE